MKTDFTGRARRDQHSLEPALQKSNSCATKALPDPNKHPGFFPGLTLQVKTPNKACTQMKLEQKNHRKGML